MQPYPYHIREEYAGEAGYTHWHTKAEAQQVRDARRQNYSEHTYRVERCDGNHSDETHPVGSPMTARRTDNRSFDLDVEIAAARARMVELIAIAMQQHDLSRADLARLIGVSPAHITQVLRGDKTASTATIVELLYAMNLRLDISLTPIQ